MVELEPLRGGRLWAYETMARKLGRVLELLDEGIVAEVVANYVFRVVVHGAEVASRDHRVPSVLARGIAVGLFHAGAVCERKVKEGRDG